MRTLFLLVALTAAACSRSDGGYYDTTNQWVATDTGVISISQRRAVAATPQSKAEDLSVDFLDQPIETLLRCGQYHYGIAASHAAMEIWDGTGARRSVQLGNRVSRLQCSESGDWVAAYASSADTMANSGTVTGLNQVTLLTAAEAFTGTDTVQVTLSVPDEPLHLVFRESGGSAAVAQPPLVILVGRTRLSVYDLSHLQSHGDATPRALIPLTVDGEAPGIVGTPILSASGQRLYLRTEKYGELLRIDLPPLNVRVSLVADTRGAAAITPISEPTALAVLRADHHLVLLDETTEQAQDIAEGLDATSATILPGEFNAEVTSILILTHGAQPRAYAVNVTQPHTTAIRLNADYTAAYPSPNRRYVVFHHQPTGYGVNGLLTIWDTRNALPRELSIPGGTIFVAFHPRANEIAMLSVDTAHIYVINLATGAVGTEPYLLEVPSDPDPDEAARARDAGEQTLAWPEAMDSVGSWGLFIGSTYPMGAVFFLPYGDSFDLTQMLSLTYLHLHKLLDTEEPAAASDKEK